MKSIPFIIAIIIAFGLSASGQPPLRLTGRVLDSDSKGGLGYASVSIKGTSLGTLSNADGEFDFYVSVAHALDTVVISMLGYEPHQAIVKGLIAKQPLVVTLVVKPFLLDEMVIHARKEDAGEILRKAFERIEDNFATKPYLMDAFFREIYEEDGKTVFFIDAVAEIGDDGFKAITSHPNRLRERVHVGQVRKSASYFKSVFEPGGFSYLTYCLRWRNIRYRNVKRMFAGQKYALDSIVYSGDHSLYVISYSMETKDYRSKDSYYIDTETYAIRKHVIGDYAKEGHILDQWRFAKDTTYWYQNKTRHVVQAYDEYKGKMYLKYVKGEFEADIYHTRTKSVEHTLRTSELLLVGGLELNNLKKAQQRENVSPWKSLRDYSVVYDAAFWNNNKEVALFPLTKRQVNDMQWEMPLEEQFKKQGIKEPLK